MGIVYLVTLLFLVIIFILTPKTDKKLDIFGFSTITIGLVFCYNVLICYILTFFVIPISLLNLSIINMICIGILCLPILKKRKIQVYEMHKIDIVYICLLGLSTLIVAYLNFGFSFNIKYETGDPSVHYITSKMFANSDSLLIKEEDTVHKSFTTMKTISYVNSGIIMKCFQGPIDSYYDYYIFIGFGIFILLVTSISMYTTISSFSIDKKTRFIAFVMSLMYTMGYPLNSLLFGFEYLSVSLFLLCLIFNMIYYFENKQLKNIFFMGMLFLLNFGLFNAYYMFIVFVYPAMWIYFCIKSYKENKKIFDKKNICLLLVTLVVPFLLGYIYYMEPQAYAIIINKNVPLGNELGGTTEYLLQKGFAVNGYIYVNLYTNMLLLLPIPIYLIIKRWEENRFSILTLIFCLLFIQILLIGFSMNKVSVYYLSKNYFALWFILFYLNYKGIIEIYKKYSEIPFILIAFYTLLIIINLILGNAEPEHTSGATNENLNTIAEVFVVNKSMIKNHNTDLTVEELQILKYLYDNIDYNRKVEIVGYMEQFFWAYSLTNYINNSDEVITDKISMAQGQYLLELKARDTEKNLNKADYIIYFNRTDAYEKMKDTISKQGDIIFENASGGIVECKK